MIKSEMNIIIESLKNPTTREATTATLNSLKVPQIISLAKDMNMTIKKHATKAVMIESFVQLIIGNRLDMESILNS